MNRASKRSEFHRFRKEVSNGVGLITYLIPCDTKLDGHPLLKDAVAFWYANMRARRPYCCSCKRTFLDDVQAAGFLLASPPGSNAAGVSAFCGRCWRDLSDAELEAAATRVLGKFVIGGRFEPLGDVS